MRPAELSLPFSLVCKQNSNISERRKIYGVSYQ